MMEQPFQESGWVQDVNGYWFDPSVHEDDDTKDQVDGDKVSYSECLAKKGYARCNLLW